METGPGIGQLNDDMEKLIMNPGRSLLDDLKEIDDPMGSYVNMQGPSSGSIYTPQGDISCKYYIQLVTLCYSLSILVHYSTELGG